jgi:hypothetical protein
MNEAPQTIALSLVSHTNAGKTTLARTLLARDVGEVRDEPHVTEAAEPFILTETPAGDRLMLWDTPGFGDSVRLARRLEQSASPIGWLLAEVWDRFRDRPFWSSQQAVRNVREQADIVLYLVNAAEDPRTAGYVDPEMRVLDWIGKPVIVLLNQLGAPRPAADEEADTQRWRAQLGVVRCLRGVLPLDAFARCWVQEAALFDTVGPLLPVSKHAAFARLRLTWLAARRSTFNSGMEIIARHLVRAASDREQLDDEGLRGRLRDVGATLGIGRDSIDSPRQAAMQRLAERLDSAVRASADELITLHGLSGLARSEIHARLAEHYAVRAPVSEGKAALAGGALTGAVAGLKADLATGGMSFGAGLLTGSVPGALGAAGLARGYNLVRGTKVASVMWSDAMLNQLATAAVLAYLAVAHYGRGRGDWVQTEHPAHWVSAVDAALAPRRETLVHLWSMRAEAGSVDYHEALRAELADATRDVLAQLYPAVPIDAMLLEQTAQRPATDAGWSPA